MNTFQRVVGTAALLGVTATAQDSFTSVPNSVMTTVGEILPESSNAGAAYVSDTYSPNVVVDALATIDVVFLWEGAGYRNTLGYFTYTDTNGVIAITSSNLIIPNVSFPGSGSLRTGDTFQLKDENGDQRIFQPGDKVGFFLIANGFGTSLVSNWTYSQAGVPSTDPAVNAARPNEGLFTTINQLNPEMASGDEAASRHLAMLWMDGVTGFLDGDDFLLCGFEDLNRVRGSDDDFNDCVFIVTATPIEAISETEVLHYNPGDPDGDGVIGLNDHFPDDPDRATLVRTPATGRTIVAFEDNYPALGDADYNDAVVAYWFETVYDANGDVKDVLGQFSLVARGAGLDSSIGLHIPGMPSNATGTILIDRFGSGAAGIQDTEDPRTIAAFVTAGKRMDDVFASTMAALPPTPGGSFSNTVSLPNEPNAADCRVLFTFDSAVDALTLGPPPFDLFLLVLGTEITGGVVDIHLPGKAALSDHAPELPAEAGGIGSYLDDNGYPWAIAVPNDWQPPMERVRIETAYPRFSDWRVSSGFQWQDWYDSPTNEDGMITARMTDVLVGREWTVKIPGR